MKTDMRVYMANRRLERRNKLLELRKSKCEQCESQKNLEFIILINQLKNLNYQGAIWIKPGS